MTPIDDETLMAYADDALPAADRARVEAALASDPNLRERLAIFSATAGHLAALDAVLHEPPPPRLAAVAGAGVAGAGAAGEAQARPSGNARPSLGTLFGWLFGSPGGFATAAATLALGAALGFTTASMLEPDTVPNGAGMASGSPEDAFGGALLQRALQSARSGERVDDLPGTPKRSIAPTLTIRTDTGSFCREFIETHEPDGAEARAWRGLACRSDGSWQLRLLAAETPPAPVAGSGYLPASDARADFDALLDRMAPGEALSADDEARAMAASWGDDAKNETPGT